MKRAIKATITVEKDKQVVEDKRTAYKTAFWPLQLNDGTEAILSVTRLSKKEWNPAETIETIEINFT